MSTAAGVGAGRQGWLRSVYLAGLLVTIGVLAMRSGTMSSTHGTEVATTPGGAPVEHERPEDWGWHHEFKGSAYLVGWAMTIALLLLTIGNHPGHIEDLYLVGIALTMAFLLIRGRRKSKNAWRS